MSVDGSMPDGTGCSTMLVNAFHGEVDWYKLFVPVGTLSSHVIGTLLKTEEP